jgi:MFS family permease
VNLRHNRRFLVLWAGNGLSLVGTAGIRIAYPLMMMVLTGSPALAGWVALALSLPALLFQVLAGVVADAVNRRQLMLVCQTGGLVATSFALLASLYQVDGYPVILIVAAFVEGTALSFFVVAEVGAVRDVVQDEHRSAAFSLLEAEQPVANLFGRTLGGALFGLARWLPFLLNAISYAFSVATLATMPRPIFDARPDQSSQPDRADTGRLWTRLADGLRWTWSIPFLRLATVATGLTNILFQAVILLVVVVSTHEFRPAWTIGVILAGAGVGGLAGSFAAPWLDRRAPARTLFLGCLWAWTSLLLLIAISQHPAVLAFAWCGVGAVGAVTAVVLTMARVRAIPEAALGRVVGAAGMLTDGAVPLGAVLAGYMLTLWSARTVGWILFAAVLAIALASTRFLAPAPLQPPEWSVPDLEDTRLRGL